MVAIQSSSDRINGNILWTPAAWTVAAAPTYKFVTEQNGKSSAFKTWLPHINQNLENFTLQQYILFCFDPAACHRLPMLRKVGETLISQLCNVAEMRLNEWTIEAGIQHRTRRMSLCQRATTCYEIQKLCRVSVNEANEASVNPKKATNLKSARERYLVGPMLDVQCFKVSSLAAREVASHLCFKLYFTC